MEDIDLHTTNVLQTLKNQLDAKIRYIMAKYRDNPMARIGLVQRANAEYFAAINSIQTLYNNSKALSPKIALPSLNINPGDKAISISKSTKKALLIGINYRNTPYELAGCINDAYSIEKLLRTRYGYSNTTVITDDSAIKPTGNNMYTRIRNFLASGVSGETLFLFYSGHGSYVRDTNRDEQMRYDQVLVGCDFVCIVDDMLKSLINTYLKRGTTLIMVADSCFSGSVLDLRYQYMDTLMNRPLNTNTKQNETVGNVILISSCQDNQTSEDTAFNGVPSGALTGAILNVLGGGSRPTWSNLINLLRNFTRQRRFSQTAQLSSGKQININTPICL
jgi:hypothetical protein